MSSVVEYNRDMFFTGEPITIDGVGSIRFLTYKEYLLNQQHLSLMNLNVLHIYYQYKKMINSKDQEVLDSLEELKEESLLNIVLNQETFSEAYFTILNLVLLEENEKRKNKIISNIFQDEDLFMGIRRLILEMQMLTESEVSKNPEIQKGIEISRELKSSSSESLTPLDIVSSIVAGSSNSFEDVTNMTVIQVNSIFYRIGAFKNYDTSVLFATVSPDVKIEAWGKSIDLFENETSTIKKKDFDRKYGSLLS